MIEFLNHIDRQLFLFVNGTMANAVFDVLCPMFRQQENWYALYAIILIVIYRRHRLNTLWIVLGATILIAATDQLSAGLIKNLAERPRPCNDPLFKDQVRLLVACGHGYSFISTHATNHFAIAFFLIRFFETERKWVLPLAVGWAAFIAFSQVYVGVHYPFDVICGALVGSVFGYYAGKVVHKKIAIKE
jgi:membrane-associated phospholipid phosphatase